MEKTILLAWEFGANLGHLANLANLTRVLVARGYRVVLALKNPQLIQKSLLGIDLRRVVVYPAPRCPTPMLKPRKAGSVMEVLLGRGYSDAEALALMVNGWRAILQLEQPAVVVADYAPTALLAIRNENGFRPLKTFLLGSGFGEVPAGADAAGLFLSSPPPDQSYRRQVETEILGVINAVAQRQMLMPLMQFSDLYAVDHTFLCTLPEFDFYQQRQLETTSYLGGLESLSQLPEVVWPPAAKHHIFAYLRADTPSFFRVVEALRRLSCGACIYAPGLNRRDVARYSDDAIKLLNSPVDMESVTREADLVIHHGGMGTSFACLRYGVPYLVVPTQLEQQVLGWKTEKLGVGLSLGLQEPIESIQHKIRRLLIEPRFEAAATAFMQRYRDLQPERSAGLICDAVDRACLIS